MNWSSIFIIFTFAWAAQTCVPALDDLSPAVASRLDPARASLPPEIAAFLRQHQLDQDFDLVYAEVNPFYLWGDFDGDHRRDYAVRLRRKGQPPTAASKLAILRGNGRLHWLAEDLKGNDGPPGPAWWVSHKEKRLRSRVDLNQRPPPKLLGDGIVLARPESSSALIYWAGQRFNLYWLSD